MLHLCDIGTSKSGAKRRQRRSIFPHPNFKKWSGTVSFFKILTCKCASRYSRVPWSETVSFLRFWLENVLLATAACNFSTSELQKVVRPWGVLYILTWKCASRYSGVQFFISPLNSYLRTRRFTEVTFRPSRHTNHWKTQHFATSLTFRAIVASFYWLSRNCIFFLLTLLLFSSFHLLTLHLCSAFQLSILSEVSLLIFLW